MSKNLIDALAEAYSAAMGDQSVRTMHDAARRIIADLARDGFSIVRQDTKERSHGMG